MHVTCMLTKSAARGKAPLEECIPILSLTITKYGYLAYHSKWRVKPPLNPTPTPTTTSMPTPAPTPTASPNNMCAQALFAGLLERPSRVRVRVSRRARVKPEQGPGLSYWCNVGCRWHAFPNTTNARKLSIKQCGVYACQNISTYAVKVFCVRLVVYFSKRSAATIVQRLLRS